VTQLRVEQVSGWPEVPWTGCFGGEAGEVGGIEVGWVVVELAAEAVAVAGASVGQTVGPVAGLAVEPDAEPDAELPAGPAAEPAVGSPAVPTVGPVGGALQGTVVADFAVSLQTPAAGTQSRVVSGRPHQGRGQEETQVLGWIYGDQWQTGQGGPEDCRTGPDPAWLGGHEPSGEGDDGSRSGPQQ
jgi:hypothetical protein